MLHRLIRTIPPSAHVPSASRIRLGLLVTGLLAAQSAVLAHAASGACRATLALLSLAEDAVVRFQV